MEDEGFSSWIENLARGSKVTSEVALRRIGRVCTLLNTTPQDLASMSRKEAGELLVAAVSRLEREGNRGSSIAGYVKSLKGWWLFNDIEVVFVIQRRLAVKLIRGFLSLPFKKEYVVQDG